MDSNATPHDAFWQQAACPSCRTLALFPIANLARCDKSDDPSICEAAEVSAGDSYIDQPQDGTNFVEKRSRAARFWREPPAPVL